MRDNNITNENQVNLSDYSSYGTNYEKSIMQYQFKILQMQQQNQILGDQSQSLMQFPSQIINNLEIIQHNSIQNDYKSDVCNLQSDEQKNVGTDHSFSNNQQDLLFKQSEQSQKCHDTNYDIFKDVSKTNGQDSYQTKQNLMQPNLKEIQCSLPSQNFKNTIKNKNAQNRTFNSGSSFDIKEQNKANSKCMEKKVALNTCIGVKYEKDSISKFFVFQTLEFERSLNQTNK
ncbi:hypothetical protein TTHERM_00396980 (macronuclear) [Tetrahymena thermophila SB210]|uniref:Uncharacterized protein n=1 Tax=Tetrahymena thermophila (strain SB210) TaxID=312017 RepID=Q232V4_TETTS|nr:hypothetical protein TTHERM_00396980 [Tetrahymena thermophila SB210]EAR91726.2 hypothetical protein TTHERM_00396980 [Tetrahymena thermophila SB210]|eukprot:XP_001011971.2 hypothetical protein TTHERM_00396980 [Tetrahymena thermophila SB210]